MKKLIALFVALTFALSLTSMVFAAEEKAPIPGLGPEEKAQIADTKKKATVEKKKATKEGVPGLGPEEKGQIADTKKKATVKKKKAPKEGVPGLGPAEKGQLEDLKKKGTVEKKPEAAPAEKK